MANNTLFNNSKWFLLESIRRCTEVSNHILNVNIHPDSDPNGFLRFRLIADLEILIEISHSILEYLTGEKFILPQEKMIMMELITNLEPKCAQLRNIMNTLNGLNPQNIFKHHEHCVDVINQIIITIQNGLDLQAIGIPHDAQ